MREMGVSQHWNAGARRHAWNDFEEYSSLVLLLLMASVEEVQDEEVVGQAGQA